MGKPIVLEKGMVFGRLTVIKYQNTDPSQGRLYKCKCECGTKVTYSACFINTGRRKHCPNCVLEKESNVTHGRTRKGMHDYTYSSWKHMKNRCLNENYDRYYDYGGRGIKICKRWLDKEKGFENFLIDMGDRTKELSLERINNEGNYTPKNCRWATKTEQQLNKRTTVFVNYRGKRMTLNAASEKSGIPKDRVLGRIKMGWDEKDLFN